MSGITLRDDILVVEREPNDLDELALQFSTTLDDLDIAHVFVSGYVAILTGRARATEDIDVLLERTSEEKLDLLGRKLEEAGLWGPAMPLNALEEMLDDNIWIARDEEIIPHLEAKFVSDEYDQASLDGRITARFASVDAELPIGPIELQIAYKLYLAAPKDFEDAVHLYSLFEENRSISELDIGYGNSTSRTTMSDSNAREDPEEKRRRNRERRVARVKRWVEYIKTHDAEEWGEQQNRLVDSQLESARQSDIDVERRRRVAQARRGREDR